MGHGIGFKWLARPRAEAVGVCVCANRVRLAYKQLLAFRRRLHPRAGWATEPPRTTATLVHIRALGQEGACAAAAASPAVRSPRAGGRPSAHRE